VEAVAAPDFQWRGHELTSEAGSISE
jgi:hypothetical protein